MFSSIVRADANAHVSGASDADFSALSSLNASSLQTFDQWSFKVLAEIAVAQAPFAWSLDWEE